MEFTFDRSRNEMYQKCPRLRFLSYEYPISGEQESATAAGNGLERVNRAVPLLTGGTIHKGIEFFLTGHGEDSAVNSALEYYDYETTSRGIVMDEQMAAQPWATIRVQRALCEALTRAWIRYMWPGINDEFEVLEVEQEERAVFEVESRQGYKATGTLLARTDVLLRRRTDQRLFVRNFKSTNTEAKWLPKKGEYYRYDTQTISEVIAAEMRLKQAVGDPGFKLDGVIYDMLCKGPRKVEYPKGSGAWHNTSPLIWCYVKEGQTGVSEDELAATWEWHCSERHKMGNGAWCPGDKDHRLGKGWNRTLVTDYFPNGILDWFQWLEDHGHNDIITAQFYTPDPIMRTDYDHEVWVRSVLNEEAHIAKLADVARSKIMAEGFADALPVLDKTFPKHTYNGNCLFPGRCQMFEICWGQVPDDPLELVGNDDRPMYVARTPNHPESGLVQIEGGE